MNATRRLIALAVMTWAASSAHAYSDLPNPGLTPGKVASLSVSEVCDKGYPARSRRVSQSTKEGVYYRYKVDPATCKDGCKIDHLIPLSIGGSNAVSNLWPHEYGADWTVYQKTRLEVRLRKEVCAGTLEITEAQKCIATNWHTCYQQHITKK